MSANFPLQLQKQKNKGDVIGFCDTSKFSERYKTDTESEMWNLELLKEWLEPTEFLIAFFVSGFVEIDCWYDLKFTFSF